MQVLIYVYRPTYLYIFIHVSIYIHLSISVLVSGLAPKRLGAPTPVVGSVRKETRGSVESKRKREKG